MAKTNQGVNGLIKKFASLSEEISQIYPKGKSVVVFSLNNEDFDYTKTQIDIYDVSNQFKLDISGIEFIFLRDELLNNVEDRT
jgi:hypothetical protein